MSAPIDPVALAQALVRLDTSGPEAREKPAIDLLAPLLAAAGFMVEIYDHAPGRPSLIARSGSREVLPIVFSGHLDTVPVGAVPWRHRPFDALVDAGRLHGRGSADMKAGVAALVAAAIDVVREGTTRPLVLILTAGEETGCLGALHLRSLGVLPRAAGIVIAEPTGNRLAIGHRGALWLRAAYEGRGAHGSMPHLGINAIHQAADGIIRCRALRFEDNDPVLGAVSLNIGTMTGGSNINSVPDHAEFTLDIRSTVPGSHDRLRADVAACLGSKAHLATMLDLPAVRSDKSSPFVQAVARALRSAGGHDAVMAVPYFTDGSILAAACDAETVILGPGDPGMAHQTDESCPVDEIRAATEIFRRIAKGEISAGE